MDIYIEGGISNSRVLCRCVKAAVIWMIWLEKNNKIFEGKREEK